MYVITIVESNDVYDSHSVKNIKSNASDLQSAMKDAEAEASNLINSEKLPCTNDKVFYFDQVKWDKPRKPTDNPVMVLNYGYDKEDYNDFDRIGSVIISVGEI